MQQLPLPGTYAESLWRPTWPPPDIRRAKQIVIDAETKDPQLMELGPGFRRGAHIVGISLAVDDLSPAYYPIRHESGGNLDAAQVLGWARREFREFRGDVIGAALLYDLDGLAAEGIEFPKVRRFYDVQVAEPLLDEHRLQYRLEALARDYLGEGKAETLLREAAIAWGFGKNEKTIKNNLWRYPARYVGAYAESDVDRPRRILPLQMKKLEEQDLLPLFDLESRLIPILLAMRRRGIKVNVSKAEETRARLVAERDRWLGIVKRLAGPKAELMTPDSLGPALEARGLVVPRTAKTNAYSITGGNQGGWLKENAGDELVDAIRAGRRVNTIITTFLDGTVLGHHINGRIHPIVHQLKNTSDDGETRGTIGRFSMEHPNGQNIPARDEELAEMIRGLFEPEDGEEWERQDESQIEFRFLAHYAVGKGSREFRQRYVDDPKTDYHKFCAEMLNADPEDKVTRKRVKNTNFAKGYGAQAKKLAATFGCSVEEAKRFITRYEKALPFSKETFDYVDEKAATRGYIRSILGRYARFPLWEPAANKKKSMEWRVPALPRERAEREYEGQPLVRANTYMALNRLMQFGNADYMKKTMVDCWEAGLCAPSVLGAPLLTVHDELDWSVPRTAAGREAAEEALRLHQTAIKLRVPVLVSVDRGANWGACR